MLNFLHIVLIFIFTLYKKFKLIYLNILVLMTKDKIYNWLFNIGYKNGLNKKNAQAFARNYR